MWWLVVDYGEYLYWMKVWILTGRAEIWLFQQALVLARASSKLINDDVAQS